MILSQIGHGGFGAVYRARQARLEREVAIKVLHPHLAAGGDMVERFRREALAAASLAHPHVLPVYDFDFDEEHGLWFLVMRFVEGAHSLADLRTPLPFDRAAGIIADVAGALDAAHARSIIHRDVKPPNVLMDGSWPLLTDFGIAHLENVSTITGTGMAIGTPTYMSPEQALGRDLSPASDQYSLAVMAYELLAGRAPFHGDPPSLLYQHVHERPPAPTSINQQLDQAASDVILRAMSKAPNDRFPSCGAFAAALAAAVLGTTMPSAYTHPTPPRAVSEPTSPPETVALQEAEPGRQPEPGPTPGPTATPAPRPHPSVAGATPRQTTLVRTIAANPVRAWLGAFAVVIVVATVSLAVARIGPGAPDGAGPSDPPRATPTVAAPRPGTIIFDDDFDDPSRARLSTDPTDPSYRLTYVNGEYEIAGHAGAVFIPGTFRDATLSFDARFIGDVAGRYISVACRASLQGWYLITILPDAGRFELEKIGGDRSHASLVPERHAPAILTGNTRNHIDLTCSGDTIEAAINGTPMPAVRDSSYTDGFFMITTGAAPDDPAEEAVLRLDNLVVRQR